MQRTDSLQKTLMLGKIEGRRKRGWQRMKWLDGITDSMGTESEQVPGVGDGQGGLACCSPWSHKGSDMTKWLNWTNSFRPSVFKKYLKSSKRHSGRLTLPICMWSGFFGVTLKWKLSKLRTIFYGGPMITLAIPVVLASKNNSPSKTLYFEPRPEGMVKNQLLLIKYGI